MILGGIVQGGAEETCVFFLKWLVLGKGGVDDVGGDPSDSLDSAVSVAMAHWNVEHRVFLVEQFLRNSDSVTFRF